MDALMGPCQVNSVRELSRHNPSTFKAAPTISQRSFGAAREMLAACKEGIEIKKADLAHRKDIKAKASGDAGPHAKILLSCGLTR